MPTAKHHWREQIQRAVELRARMLYKWPLRSGFEMRAKLILVTLVGLLFCSLATLETTELLKLADDASNDFSLPQSEHETSSAIVCKSVAVQPGAFPTTDESEPRRVWCRDADSSYPAKDFLHFLCIMRT
jgi:hypothetical protein